jgi:hypothetical protein
MYNRYQTRYSFAFPLTRENKLSSNGEIDFNRPANQSFVVDDNMNFVNRDKTKTDYFLTRYLFGPNKKAKLLDNIIYIGYNEHFTPEEASVIKDLASHGVIPQILYDWPDFDKISYEPQSDIYSQPTGGMTLQKPINTMPSDMLMSIEKDKFTNPLKKLALRSRPSTRTTTSRAPRSARGRAKKN